MDRLGTTKPQTAPAGEGVIEPDRLAAELVDRAFWSGELAAPTEHLLAVFEAAAAYALVPEERLQQEVQNGRCLVDPEKWFASVPTAGWEEEREHAERQCAGCPFQAQCLALDLTAARGRVSWLHGVWGGLGTRDRTQLQPLWRQLVARLRAQQGDRSSWRTPTTTITRGDR